MKRLPVLFLVLLLVGCPDAGNGPRGVYLVADLSDNHAQLATELDALIIDLVDRMGPGDALAVERVDMAWREGLRLDSRPSRAVAQKRVLVSHLEKMVVVGEGGVAGVGLANSVENGVRFLSAPDLVDRVVLLLSDLSDSRPVGLPSDLNGYRVLAVNVTQKGSRSSDTWTYLRRIDDWQRAVESRGGEWQVVSLEPAISDELLPR